MIASIECGLISNNKIKRAAVCHGGSCIMSRTIIMFRIVPTYKTYAIYNTYDTHRTKMGFVLCKAHFYCLFMVYP